MRRLMFEIPGEPVAKARPRVVNLRGYSVAYTPEKTKSFENLVKMMYVNKYKDTKLEGPLSLTIHAFFSIPKSTSKKLKNEWIHGRCPVIKKPDTDNLAKAIADSLNKIAYNDDSQIAEIYVTKEYAERPRTMVIIREIEKVGTNNLDEEEWK